MCVTIKNNYLKPLRHQIKNIINHNSSVVDFGCGDGDLLFTISKKISYGIGIDKSKKRITRANYISKKKNIQNIQFKTLDLTTDKILLNQYDYAVASLFLHVLPRKSSIQLIEKMSSIANQLIICAFTNPKKKIQRFLLEFDQLFTNHHGNYLNYKNKGGIESLIQETQIDFNSIIYYPSFDESITICVIS